ncbi:hypothetical protein ACX8Z9_15270 [Arthrobacter halodurans]|uniref:RES domain-containing protein n=1 Tax=Arthrobacter halodurans TaxID=516699 RepID=A0ABV4USM4_9MICC
MVHRKPPPVPADDVGPVAAAGFRRLCRSSPWRWETLRFDVEWRVPAARRGLAAPGSAAGAEAVPRVCAWLRRPDALRVEDPAGRLLFSTTRINDSRGAFYIASTRKSWLLPPRLTTPVYDDDGLVRRRPEAAYGDPVFADPRWAAMLDPVELAGNAPVALEFPFSNVVEIHALADGVHEGRACVEAVVSPNQTYRPAAEGFPLLGPGRSRVRIDLQTAVCVYSEALDGADRGAGHDLGILGVDEYMLDDLFVEHSMHLTDVRDHIPWVVPPEAP